MLSADLLCQETMSPLTDKRQEQTGTSTSDIESALLNMRCRVDKVLLADTRVVQNMLHQEAKQCTEKTDYCGAYTKNGGNAGCTVIGRNVRPHMRKIVLDWMLEVVQDARSEMQVFHLAADYFDRYLSRRGGGSAIGKSQLQLLGTTCLFLAAKMVSGGSLTMGDDLARAEHLLAYTDHSVTLTELLHMEILLLHELDWELNSVTPLAFMDHFLQHTLMANSHETSDHSQRKYQTPTTTPTAGRMSTPRTPTTSSDYSSPAAANRGLRRQPPKRQQLSAPANITGAFVSNPALVHQQSEDILKLITSEYQYLLLPPSLIAAAALSVAVATTATATDSALANRPQQRDELHGRLAATIQRPVADLRLVVESVEEMLMQMAADQQMDCLRQGLDVNHHDLTKAVKEGQANGQDKFVGSEDLNMSIGVEMPQVV